MYVCREDGLDRVAMLKKRMEEVKRKREEAKKRAKAAQANVA